MIVGEQVIRKAIPDITIEVLNHGTGHVDEMQGVGTWVEVSPSALRRLVSNPYFFGAVPIFCFTDRL